MTKSTRQTVPSQKSRMFCMFFVCLVSEVCFLHVCGNGWDQKHV